MKVSDYKKTVKTPLRQATICLLIKEDKILLAMKKRGFGMGKWNGVGGKPNNGELIEDAAIRETQEEIGVTPKNIQKVATLNFYFPNHPDWSQQVLVYNVKEWDGEPMETEEMAPKWFPKDQIPYDSMWEDDKYWFPLVLAGKSVDADFLFEGEKLLDFKVSESFTKRIKK